MIILILFLIFVFVAISAPSAQVASPKPLSYDSGVRVQYIPKPLLEKALDDSLAKLNRLMHENDSMLQERREKSAKVLYHINRLLKKKTPTKPKPDTVYVPVPVDMAFMKDLFGAGKVIKTDSPKVTIKIDSPIVSKKKKGIFGGLFKNKTKN